MSSYKLLVRLMKEQCIVEEEVTIKGRKISVKPNKEVSSDSLQNPSDPDAGYSGHKGKEYQVQVIEYIYNFKERFLSAAMKIRKISGPSHIDYRFEMKFAALFITSVSCIMNSRNRIKHFFPVMVLVVFSLCLFCEPVVAAADNADIYLKTEFFTWKEYDDSGSQLLKESGPISAIGSSVRSDIAGPLVLRGKGELFGGPVNYDGQTQTGTPVETSTIYAGLKVEGNLGWNFMVAEKSALEPFAGLGYRWWQRDIQDTVYATGYKETWWSFYARLGIHGEHTFSEQLKAFAEAGLKIPLKNKNKVDLNGIGLSTVTVEPGNVVSVFAEAGLKWTRFRADLFYEGMRFSKSDPVTVSNVRVWQPESKADTFGISVGMDF